MIFGTGLCGFGTDLCGFGTDLFGFCTDLFGFGTDLCGLRSQHELLSIENRTNNVLVTLGKTINYKIDSSATLQLECFCISSNKYVF